MTLGYFSAGDSPFFFSEQLQQISWLPNIWDATTGFGRSTLVQLWIDYPIRLIIKLLSSIGLDWWSIDKILWIIPFVLAIFSIYKLSALLRMTTWQISIATVIYVTNTYVLLLFDGGQRGVLLAYSFVPFIIYSYLRYIDSYTKWILNEKDRICKSIALSLIWGILIAFDLRFAYLVVISTSVYFVIRFYFQKIPIAHAVYLFFWLFILPLIGAGMLHSFWILPLSITRSAISLGEEYTSAGMLKFLSVADFSHALSLLHPNWPENLFGKVYFLQPEFLLLPVIAFGSLFSISKFTKQHIGVRVHILFFAFIALLGAFFAKGVQEPLGGIFAWMFDYVPGFVMFRDPTKFYLFIALGYSILIPVTFGYMHNVILHILKKRNTHNLALPGIVMLFVIIWAYTIRPVFLGKLTGNFNPKTISVDYIKLKDSLVRDDIPSRVLWLPSPEKFNYTSSIHPVITAEKLFSTTSISRLLAIIDSSSFIQSLDGAGVKYIVIPIDVWKRLFLNNYEFDQTQRHVLSDALARNGFVKEGGFDELHVYTNATYHFNSGKPEYIVRQEYFMRIGLGISILSLVSMIIIFLKYRKKQS